MGLAEGSGWVADVAELAGLAVAGRILLAWLPSGRPGSHQGRELAATWAASHLLGLALATIGEDLAWRAGLDARTANVIAGIALGALLAARLITAPAGLVPRHEPAPARWTMPSRLVVLASVVTIVLGPLLLGEPLRPPLSVASTIAALIFLAYALDLARAPAGVQAATCAAFAWFYVLVLRTHPEAVLIMVGAAAAAAGSVGWLRRADARALALAAVAIAWLAAHREGGTAIAAGLGLCIPLGTPRPSRLRAALHCGGAFVLGLAATRQGYNSSLQMLTSDHTGWYLAFLAFVVAGTLLGWFAERRGRAWNPSGAPVGHESRVLLYAVTTGCAVSVAHLLGAQRFEYRANVFLPFVAGCVLITVVAGLGWTRWRNTSRRAP